MLLMGASTLRVVKSHISESCLALAEKSGCCGGDDIPEGCQKEKCVLNINFSAGQFIVQQIQNLSIPVVFETQVKKNLVYEKSFIPHYYNKFWHPPEINS